MTTMTPSQARAYAASWGGLMRASHPGSCMFQFDGYSVQDEAHRAACIAWIDRHCLPTVSANLDWQHFDADEADKLQALRDMILRAPVAAEQAA